MSTNTIGLFIRHLALSQELKCLKDNSDRDLLTVYQAERSEAAFTELMRRYEALVLRTCRRVLGAGPDAEDAFQATFILLARKAGKLGCEAAGALSLGGWLHRVAYRTALNVVKGMGRRKAREQQANDMALRPASSSDPTAEATWNEVQPILDEELDALPEEARRLLITCYLHGKSYTEASAELRMSRSSLVRQLSRARALLASRLARRGVTVPAALLAVLLEATAKGTGVPAVLRVHTVEAARRFTEQTTGIVSENVTRLVKGGLAQMNRRWSHWSMALAGWVGLFGVVLIACQTLKAWPDRPSEDEQPSAERPAQGAARTDLYGDPLPPGALARMGTVRLFNGELAQNPSTLLAFSPDGKVLASHIKRMTVALWDAATGKEIRRLTLDPGKGRDGSIFSLGLAPDGKTLVTVTSHQRVYFWQADTGKLLRTVNYKDSQRKDIEPHRVTFLPDGRMLAAVPFLKTVENGKGVWGIYVWDVANGKEVCELSYSKEIGLPASAFSPDGKLLATTGGRDISLWDVATGKEIRQLTHEGAPERRGVYGLTFSRDGKMLASTDAATVCVWDVASGKHLRSLKASGHVYGAALAFSPDGKTLVGGQEGHLWEVSSGKEIRSLGLEEAKVALFSPDGKTLAVGDEKGVIRLWDMATDKESFPHPGHRQRITTVTDSPDGKTLASKGSDQTIRLWDVATGKELRKLPKHFDFGANSIVYSPDGKLLASTDNNTLHFWDTATGKEIRRRERPGGKICSVAFSPDGKVVAVGLGCEPPTVAVWEVATGKSVYMLATKYPADNIPWGYFPVVFSPDGRLLAAPGGQNTVSLWDMATGKSVGELEGLNPLAPLERGKASVHFLAFSPDGRVLATSSLEDKKIHLWEVASRKQIGQLDGYHTWECLRGCVLAFSPDGRMLATAPVKYNFDSVGSAVTLWEVASGREIGRLAGHRNIIRTLAFSPDGKTLASGSDDLTCLVWDVAAVTGPFNSDAVDARLPKSFSKEQLEAAWADLANTDPAKAYRAVSVLRAAPEQAVPLLKARVRPASPVADPKQLANWIADLDNESFAVRAKAQRAIAGLGEPAIPVLRRALADQPSLEVKRRLQQILTVIEPKLSTDSPERLCQIRAVQVLESITTLEAQQVLQSLTKGVAEASLTREARAALERLAKRSASRP